MKAANLVPALACALALAACVPSVDASAPAPAPAPVARPAPAPAPAPPPPVQAMASDDWMDAPATPGTWRYGTQGSDTEAGFWSATNAPMVRLVCITATRNLALSLPQSGAARPLVTIRTETATRTVEARPGDRDMIIPLYPQDPLLDAMALSKGRFAVETDGQSPLYLPAWAEVSRVIEDCRG